MSTSGDDHDNKNARYSRVEQIDAWETALRIRGVLVLRQLVELERTAREIPFEAQANAVAYIHREISRAITQYSFESSGRVALDERQALRAIIEAETTIDAIGRDPAVVAFLAAGSKADMAHYRSSCRTLMALLDMSTTSATKEGWTR